MPKDRHYRLIHECIQFEGMGIIGDNDCVPFDVEIDHVLHCLQHKDRSHSNPLGGDLLQYVKLLMWTWF